MTAEASAEALPARPELYADVAVPVPIHETLTYRVPADLASLATGARVRVAVGRRQNLTGVALKLHRETPQGFEVKDLLEVLDLEPVLTPELLELARFVAEYYLAPIGEAVRAMIPRDLPPWGNRRISLTDGGALTPPRSAAEERLRDFLLARPRARVAELQSHFELTELARLIDDLGRRGWIAVEDPGRRSRGTRYVKAVELKPGDPEAQLAACGRSPKARAVVEYLRSIGRPATLREVTGAVGCGPGVVRRLVELGLLREFTQPERLDLGRHRLRHESAAAPLVLRADQETAVAALETAVDDHRYAPFLLSGMTGSGKTEVYLRAAEATLRRGRSAILLVPEIALVPALAQVCRDRFGSELAILHSNLSSAERHQEWERVRGGAARVVLGPRSALLAPVADLGLIVVDEEQDAAYKQDVVPRYHGRDLALLRARNHRATAVLASATPSLESRYNVERGKLRPLELVARVGGGMPEHILVDLRREEVRLRPGEVHFSTLLRDEIGTAVKNGDQVILLRNRRGYSPLLLCRACGEDFRCEDCGLPLTYHRREGRLLCHYCAHSRPKPTLCPSCGEAALEPIGAGTERVEEQFEALFPQVPVGVLDADATRRSGGAAAILQDFASGRTQVLIGTQMVSKGHHFPRVALAAVLFADTYLGFPDFRAVERTWALLTQLAGRAGRGERPGRVVIQTLHPDHYAIRAVVEEIPEIFYREEMRFRRTFHYPPYTRMVQILAQHKNRGRAEDSLRQATERLLAHPLAPGVRFAGPALAPLEKLRGKWRFQLLLRGPSSARLRQLVRESLLAQPSPDLTVDVDPQDLM